MEGSYNLRNPAVKRLMREAEELRNPTEEYFAQPLEENLFEWHFTVRGPPNTDFSGGLYHGRITLPPEYPMKPPSIILLTPNGRFEINKKICLSISGHHPESWQPSWSIRTALLAIIGFMPTHANGAIGALDYTPEERQVLARKSQLWKCSDCGDICDLLKAETAGKSEKTLLESITHTSPLVSPEASKVKVTSNEPDHMQITRRQTTHNIGDTAVQPIKEHQATPAVLPSHPMHTDTSTARNELNHMSEQVQPTTVSSPRLRLNQASRQTDQPSPRTRRSERRNNVVLPSAATSTTFIGILTFLIVFLVLRRLSSYIDCF